MTFAPFTVDRIRCKDCNAEFQIASDNVSGSRLEQSHARAAVLVWVPKVCPACRNIKAVPDEEA